MENRPAPCGPNATFEHGMNRAFRIIGLAASVTLILATRTFAGPPFLTDDPEPVDFQHWEAYLFALGDHTGDGGYTIEARRLN
jgi:hypothetical protein